MNGLHNFSDAFCIELTVAELTVTTCQLMNGLHNFSDAFCIELTVAELTVTTCQLRISHKVC